MRTCLHRTIILLVLASLCAGYAISARGSSSFELELMRAEMQEAGPQVAAALAQYPQASMRVYMLYGHTPELREVFQKFGHNQIVPIIEKCFEQGDVLIELSTQIGGLLSSLTQGKANVGAVSPAECGWRAILLTRAAGNNFLGQYVIDSSGRARLLPGSSLLAILKRLTTGGLQLVERRLVLGENPTSREWGLAALDIAVAAVAGKAITTALKPGIARAARPTLGSMRSGIGVFAQTYAPTIAKYGTITGVAYLVLHHPRVISGAAKILADTLGVTPLLVQTIVWGTILFVPLWIILWAIGVLRSILRSIARLIKIGSFLQTQPFASTREIPVPLTCR